MPTRARKEDNRFVMQRAEDRSFWAAFDYYTTKFKLLVWLVVMLLIALGFDWKTPKAIFSDLQAQITANKKQVDETLKPRIDEVNEKVDVLLRLRCNDMTVSPGQRALSGLSTFCDGHPTGSQK